MSKRNLQLHQPHMMSSMNLKSGWGDVKMSQFSFQNETQ